jgi:exopolysaccharide biosynthesis protein
LITKRTILPWLFVFIAVFLSSAGRAEISINEKGKWKRIIPGLEMRVIKITAERGPADIYAFRIDQKKLSIRVVDSRDYQQKRLSVRSMTEVSGAVLAINGGFFDTEEKHLGLLVRDGKTVSPYLKRDWGIFFMKKNRPFIIHSRKYKKDKGITQAVQVGPRLISRGKVLKLKKQFSRRSAVGIDGKERIILLVSGKNPDQGILGLTELAELMGLSLKKGGLGCQYALNLDGGASTQLYVNTDTFTLNLPGRWAVSNGLGVFRK